MGGSWSFANQMSALNVNTGNQRGGVDDSVGMAEQIKFLEAQVKEMQDEMTFTSQSQVKA
jgi:hypothetical protein